MKVLLCVEGGGEINATSNIFRNNFARFFAKSLPGHDQIKVQACGGRDDTIALFNRAVREKVADVILLLVDSDGLVPDGMSAKEYLRSKTSRLWANAKEDQIHLMVQCMEAWFLADREALAEFYGQTVSKSKWLRRTDIERIEDAEELLKKATKNSGKEYVKSHGFFLIGMVNPDKVRKVAKHCDRLLRKLEQELGRR